MAKTSGEIYHNAVRRGLDNGYAMWLADEWQMRHDKKECEWCGSQHVSWSNKNDFQCSLV